MEGAWLHQVEDPLKRLEALITVPQNFGQLQTRMDEF